MSVWGQRQATQWLSKDVNIYWHSGVHWSGAITEVLARPVACPYMGYWPMSRSQSDKLESQ